MPDQWVSALPLQAHSSPTFQAHLLPFPTPTTHPLTPIVHCSTAGAMSDWTYEEDLEERIVGGEFTEDGDFPELVSS